MIEKPIAEWTFEDVHRLKGDERAKAIRLWHDFVRASREKRKEWY